MVKILLLFAFKLLVAMHLFGQSPDSIGLTARQQDDDCSAAKPYINTLNDFVKSRAYLEAQTEIQQAALADGLEHTVTFGRAPGDSITHSPIAKGSSSRNGSVNSKWPAVFADLHNHPDNLPPSPGDYYGLVALATNHPAYHTRMAFLGDRTTFALVIYDLDAAKKFVQQFPKVTERGYSPKFPEPVISAFYKVRDAFIYQGFDHRDADSYGMAYILATYNMGAFLFRQSDSGIFYKIGVTEVLSFENLSYKAADCF